MIPREKYYRLVRFLLRTKWSWVYLMYPCLFKKNPNQLCPKKMINKYANTCTAQVSTMRKHKHDISIFFWGLKNYFFENKQRQSLNCLQNYRMINFLTILKFCASSIKSQNSRELTFVVEPMLNNSCKHCFCDFVRIPHKFLPFLR